MSVDGAAVEIGVEPSPHNSHALLSLKPLVNDNTVDLGAGVLQSLGNQAAHFPTGSARLQ
ncbi:MAG: hypothetical protein AAGA56_19865 [Myxococcota bacterium]